MVSTLQTTTMSPIYYPRQDEQDYTRIYFKPLNLTIICVYIILKDNINSAISLVKIWVIIYTTQSHNGSFTYGRGRRNSQVPENINKLFEIERAVSRQFYYVLKFNLILHIYIYSSQKHVDAAKIITHVNGKKLHSIMLYTYINI